MLLKNWAPGACYKIAKKPNFEGPFSSPEGHRAVGLDINANHLKSATSGWVTGVARPVHIGRTTQVWQIDLHNEAGELTCVSRITMAVLAPR